jgi:PKD repeat protein
MKMLQTVKRSITILLFVILVFSCEKREETAQPVACFEPSKTTAGVGETITFIDCSENVEKYAWNFGDNSAISRESSPSHAYTEPGTYTVILTVFNKEKTDETSVTITIEQTSSSLRVTTGQVKNITSSSVVVTGNIESFGEGYSSVSDWGHCWSSTNQNPTLENSDGYTNHGERNNTGPIESELLTLSPGTPYYVRAYATNSEGTAYGDVISFTTTDESSSANINLTPTAGNGWADNIVLSSQSEDYAENFELSAEGDIYISFAVDNTETDNIAPEMMTVEVYVDDILKITVTNMYDFPSDKIYTFTDYTLEDIQPGTHTIKIVIDPNNTIDESNENDNEYERTFTFGGLPDLQAGIPESWDKALIVTNEKDDFAGGKTLQVSEELYINYAYGNFGESPLFGNVNSKIYIDGELVLQNNSEDYPEIIPPLNVEHVHKFFNHSIGKLSAGEHTIEMVVDESNMITEENEDNNSYSITIKVQGSGSSNLTYATPAASSWYDFIVFGPNQDDFSQPKNLYATDDIYIGFGIANFGESNPVGSYTVKVYIDGIEKVSKTYTDSPDPNKGYFPVEYIGQLSAGKHNVSLVIDEENNIIETNETDNNYDITIEVLEQIAPNGFNYNKNFHETTKAYLFYYGTDDTESFGSYELDLVSESVTYSSTYEELRGQGDLIGFWLYSNEPDKLSPGEYPYNNTDNAKAMTHWGGGIGININMTDELINDIIFFEDGYININISGDRWTINYEVFDIDGNSINGSYTGPITNIRSTSGKKSKIKHIKKY